METQNIIVQSALALAEAGSCILIFLPGIGEISTIQDDLEQASCPCPLQVRNDSQNEAADSENEAVE